MRNKLLAALAALVLVGLALIAAPAQADFGNAGDSTCTSGTFTGNDFVSGGGPSSGDWLRDYNPNCSNNTTASVHISWLNYLASNGDKHIQWRADITTGAIYGSRCVYVALDWTPPAAQHSDVQFARNCDENSTYSTPTVDINVGSSPNWPVGRLQLGTYNPNSCGSTTCDVINVVCPSSGTHLPVRTDTNTECTQWLTTNGAAQMSSKAAKIFRQRDGGVDDQNDPQWPNGYGVNQLTDITI